MTASSSDSHRVCRARRSPRRTTWLFHGDSRTTAMAATPCPTGRPRPLRSEIGSPSVMFDAGLGVRIGGLQPGQRVTGDAAARAADNATWRARVTFVADEAGTVDPATTPPVDGDYSGVHET